MNRRSWPLALVSTGFVVLWLFIAAFPFLWTSWGSFKAEADFFSRVDWWHAITGPATTAQTGSAFTGAGYYGAWVLQGFWKSAINTFIVTLFVIASITRAPQNGGAATG